GVHQPDAYRRGISSADETGQLHARVSRREPPEKCRMKTMTADWPLEIHRELKAAGIRLVGYVPDAGHKRLIELCRADKAMRAVLLSSEEEGIGLAAGAWL